MNTDGFFKKVLQRPPLTGGWALVFGVAAVAVPTLIRALLDGSVTGLAFIVYVPAVVLAALLMRGWQAAVVALACAAAADCFFLEQDYRITFSATDLIGIPVFLASSALIIAVVRTVRRFIIVSPDSVPAKVIFSEEKGHAWAHWDGDRPSLPLGPHTEVAEMMEDYIAQVELGKRLTRQDRKL